MWSRLQPQRRLSRPGRGSVAPRPRSRRRWLEGACGSVLLCTCCGVLSLRLLKSRAIDVSDRSKLLT